MTESLHRGWPTSQKAKGHNFYRVTSKRQMVLMGLLELPHPFTKNKKKNRGERKTRMKPGEEQHIPLVIPRGLRCHCVGKLGLKGAERVKDEIEVGTESKCGGMTSCCKFLFSPKKVFKSTQASDGLSQGFTLLSCLFPKSDARYNWSSCNCSTVQSLLNKMRKQRAYLHRRQTVQQIKKKPDLLFSK